MEANYTLVPDLLSEASAPPNGIVSRTLHNDDRLKIILFSFDAGQELSAHSAPVPAVLQILEGEARVTLGSDVHDVKAGALVRMAPDCRHGVFAKTRLAMLLLMVKGG